jgi:phosphomethylpyrimidine synthase
VRAHNFQAMNVTIKSGRGPIHAGHACPTLVMALVGTSSVRDHASQVEKIDALNSMKDGPDIISDLSIATSTTPLWRHIIGSGHPAATLPVYTVTRDGPFIEPERLLDVALGQMEDGVGLLTIHPTPTRDIIFASRSRLTPWTSRGGGLIIRDLLARNDQENAYLKILPELVCSAKKHGTVLSLGASFRSANIFDSMDKAQIAEIDLQIQLASSISRAGVGVIIESPGHARPKDIQACAKLLASSGFPIMPLGPMPTDAAIGFDHVAAAIGATIMGMEGAAHILAAVTREEHTGGIPTISSTLEAVAAARVAAHVIDIHRLDATGLDAEIVRKRVEARTCIAGKATSGCIRCGTTCPL